MASRTMPASQMPPTPRKPVTLMGLKTKLSLNWGMTTQ